MPIDPIRDWLNAIGALTAGSMPVAEARAKLGAYTPLLMQRFPTVVFTPQSLEAVAAQCKFFPSYAEICDHLGAWWRENRPVEKRLPPPAYDPPRLPPERTPEEIAAVSAMVMGLKSELAQRRAEAPRRHGEVVQPRYLTPDQLQAKYAAEGVKLTPPWVGLP